MSSCEFCKTTFNTKSSLKNHLRTAKYCIQNRTETFTKEIVIFDCKYCNKILSSKQNLNIHFQICIPRYEKMLKEKEDENQILKTEIINTEKYKEQISEYKEQISEYKEQIKELQNKIERMATKAIEKPTNQTNLFLSPIDLSQEHITKVIQEKFTKEHFYDGQAGVARFAVDNILKDKDGKLGYICTDPARQIFKHVTSDGELKKDVRASKLTKKLVKDVKKVSGDIVLKKMKETNESTEFKKFDKDVSLNFLTKKMDEIAIIEDDNSKFRAELANLTVEN
jgi:hypothetical protein